MKKKWTSRIVASALAVAMLGALYVPVPARAADSAVKGGITAVVRLDYAQRIDELRRRNIRAELKRDGRSLGSVVLTEEGSFTVDGYPAQVTARNTDGGELLGGQWPGSLEVSFEGLPRGNYELVFTGKGYKTYSRTLKLDQYALYLAVGTGDATFTLGDVNGDGRVDAADRAAISHVLGSTRSEDLLQYDLSGEGVIDIVDLAYVDRLITAEGASEPQETALLVLPADLAEMEKEIAKNGTQVAGQLSDIFAGNGAGVTLTPKSGEHVVLPLPLSEKVETQEIRVVSPAGDGAVLAGTMLVEIAGEEKPMELPFDNTPPMDVHATARSLGSSVITVDLGRRVPVKKVTITVTKTEGGSFAVVDSVQFLKDIVPEVPVAPNSVVKKVSAEAGSEMVTLSWSELPNVSGYKVLYWPEKDVKSVQELHVDVNRAEVKGLKNLETYAFTVTPTDGSWEGKPSAPPVTATPQPASVPDKVDMVSVAEMDAALGVSWKKGKSATYYEVYYQEKNTDRWLQAGGRLTDTRTTITGLTNDVTYSIYVVAGNDVGKGPRSAIYEGVPRAVKYERPEGIPTQGILDSALISDIRLADAGNHTAGAFDPKWMIDNDYRTAWTAQNWWRNEHVVTTFTRPVDLNAAVWVPRLDGSYPANLRAYSVRVWYDGEDLSGAGHLIVPNPQAGGIDNGGTGRDVDTWPGVRGNAAVTNFAILPFGPVENVKKISVAIEQRAYTTVSLSELMFMEYDPAHSLPGEIDALFADGLHTQLRSGVTREAVAALQTRLQSDERNYYYDLNTMADELKLAGELLESGRSSGVQLSGLDSRSGAADTKYSQGGSVLQSLGVTAGARQEITIYAEGIPAGEKVEVVATQFNAEVSQWQASLGSLENGRNVLTVPRIGSRSGNNGGSLYAVYGGSGGENIRLHIRRGVDIPVLELAHWYAMSEAERRTAMVAYVDELDAYLGSFKLGSVTEDYRNVTEISTPVVLLSLPAQAVKNALGAGSREEKTAVLYNDILAWEDIMAICRRTQGIDKVYAQNDMQTRQNVRCMTMFAGAFMYAAGSHIGIGYGSCGGMVTGRPISTLGENATANQLFGWGIAHEIGHNMDKLGKAEITNNIYSIMVQTWDGKANTLPSRLEKSGKYPDIFTKTAQGWPGASNSVFVQLGMYWQLHLAYDGAAEPLSFYNRFFKAWKAGTYTAGATSYDDRLALTAAGVAERDLTEFFTRWGMSLSESAKETLGKYAKEDRALWYLSDQSRRESIAGTAAATGTVKASAALTAGKDNEITVAIDPSGIRGKLQGYEVRRNGKSIAFVPAGEGGSAVYTDVIGSGNHRLYAYEVAAYDILGNQVGAAANAGEVRVAYDKTVDPSKYTITLSGGTAVIRLSEETAVSGLKLSGVTPGVGSYTVTIADEAGKSSEALRSTFAAENNQAVDDRGSYVAYFKMPGAESTDTRIWTYDAKTVTITGVPAGVQAENILLITYPGDDVAFLEGGTMGLLAEDYHYTSLDEEGKEVDEVVPKGTLVILGTYRGDPVYNTLMVMGRYTGTASGEDGEMVETAVVERAVAGYAFLFAEVPAVGEVSDISDGIFLFIPDVQQEAQLQGENSHCDVQSLLPAQIRVDFFRTDEPNNTASKRLTAQTTWIHSPGGTQEDLPAVVLRGGQGK